MKKLWIMLIILVVIVVIVVIGIRLAKRVITEEGVVKIAEKAIESVEEKAKEAEEKVSPKEEEVTTEEAEAPAKEVSTGKMNDDIYVEIMAHQIYLPDKYSKKYGKKVHTDPATAEKFLAEFNDEMEKLYKKFGVTEDAYNDYTEQLAEDIERYTKVMERVSQRIEELKKGK